MSALAELHARRDAIYALAVRHGVTKIRVFGSVAREEEGEDSDVDFLIRMKEGSSLLDMAVFQTEMEELLHKRVDVVSENGIYHRLREAILRDAKEF